jgi:NADPH:quinone reductase-like Zn-dependent oxidoreductase
MKAVICERWGKPAEVLEVRDVPEPRLGSGEVLVRMIASPINPSDLLYIRGQYGLSGKLPTVPGFEGVGLVEAGAGFLARRVRGKRVAVINGVTGNWQEKVVIPAKQAIPVPAHLSDEQVATFFVNPASALVMTSYVLRIPRGAWLLQTAAGSALGRMVIRLGQMNGFKTINVVRRREQAEELLKLGGTAAISTNEESIVEKVRELTGGKGVPYAIDAVGGATGAAVVQALASGGRMLVYGTLAAEPTPVDPRWLISGQKRIEGFWLAEWVRAQGILRMLWLFRKVAKLIGSGVLDTDIGATFPLDDVKSAVAAAEQPGKRGKVLLRIGS